MQLNSRNKQMYSQSWLQQCESTNEILPAIFRGFVPRPH